MSKLVFDLEADNLLEDATRIWCISTWDLCTDNRDHYGPDKIEKGIVKLLEAQLLIGHNICGYDIPLIEKLYSQAGMFDLSKCRDTYVMSKLFWPERTEHSLEAWGNELGTAKKFHEEWTRYSFEMRVRCDQDVEINRKLYNYMVEVECKDWPQWKQPIILEGEMHYWQAIQELVGVGFDIDKAKILLEQLDKEIAEIDEELYATLPMKCKQVGTTVKAPFKKNGEYSKRVEDWFSE
jgi:hypothetical protein